MAHATTPISTALDRVIRRESTRLAAKMALVGKGAHADRDDGETIRRARVASRRLREALAFVRAAAAGSRVTRLGRDVRKFTRALGPVREVDVALEELRAATTRHAWRPSAVAAVRRHLEHVREERRAALAEALRPLDADDIEERAAAVAAKYVVNTSDLLLRRALAMRIAERGQDAAARLAELGTLYVPERLHALRIAVKKLRYVVELVGPSTAGASDVVRALRRGQRQFGHLHDLQGLLAEVRATAAELGPTVLGGRVLAIADRLERECRELYAEMRSGTPALAEAAYRARRQLVVALRAGRPSMSKAFPAAGPQAARRLGRWPLAAGTRNEPS